MQFFEFDEVDAFTTGTVGQPGSRTFFIQARSGRQQVNVKCEKQQAAAIAQYLRRILADLPDVADRPIASSLQPIEPTSIAFVLGPIGLAFDGQGDRFMVQLEEVVDVDEDGEPIEDAEQGRLRLYISRGQALAFCDHTDAVVAAGRPACIFCGGPIDPDGHPCPRMN